MSTYRINHQENQILKRYPYVILLIDSGFKPGESRKVGCSTSPLPLLKERAIDPAPDGN